MQLDYAEWREALLRLIEECTLSLGKIIGIHVCGMGVWQLISKSRTMDLQAFFYDENIFGNIHINNE